MIDHQFLIDCNNGIKTALTKEEHQTIIETVKTYADINGEVWVDIKGNYPGYMISNLGRIFSKKTNKFLKPKNKDTIEFRNSRTDKKTYSIRSLIAHHFLGKHLQGYQVEKLDSNHPIILTNIYYKESIKINENYFEVIDTLDKAYWLGFLFADGCITETSFNYYRLVLALSTKDINSIEKFKQDIEFTGNISNGTYINNVGKQDRSTIRIYNQKICSDLIKLGCIPSKTYNLVYPKQYLNSKELNYAFILGYYDGNGYLVITKNKHNNIYHAGGICCNSFEFLETIRDILKLSVTIYDRSNSYNIFINKPTMEMLFSNYSKSMIRKRF